MNVSFSLAVRTAACLMLALPVIGLTPMATMGASQESPKQKEAEIIEGAKREGY